MNIKSEINSIKIQLEELNDEYIIAAIKRLLNEARSEAYRSKLKPMTQEQLVARALQAEDDIKNNRLTDFEDLKREIDKW